MHKHHFNSGIASASLRSDEIEQRFRCEMLFITSHSARFNLTRVIGWKTGSQNALIVEEVEIKMFTIRQRQELDV